MAQRPSSSGFEPDLTDSQLSQLAGRVNQLRAEAKLSTNDLAAGAGLSTAGAQRLLAGTLDPRLGTLIALVRLFNLASLDQLLGELPTSDFLRRGPAD